MTGASGGIGKAVVERALQEGARVFSVDMKTPQNGQRSERATCFLHMTHDVVSDPAPVFRKLDRSFGRLDVFVHAAGAVGEGSVESTSAADWRKLIEINVTSAFVFAHHAIPRLRKTQGSIVFLSSTNGMTGGSPLSGPAYAVAKAGLIALTKNIARDVAPFGVRANCVAPGPIDTPMLDRLPQAVKAKLRKTIPMGRIGEANEVASAIAFLASKEARYLTGITLPVSGGLVMS